MVTATPTHTAPALRPAHQRRAGILVATVVALTIILLVVSTMVISGGREAELTKARFQAAQDLYAADAAANIALREVRQNADLDGDGAVGTISNDGSDATDPTLNGVRMHVASAAASTFTINAGNSASARNATLTIISPSTPIYSDGFEAYTTDSALAGQGGWDGWDGNAGATAYASNIYTRNGVESQDVRGPTDSVHTFALTSGKWTLTIWQYIPTAATGGNPYLMLLNTYSVGGGKGWSTQLYFDLGSNTVYDNLVGGVAGSVLTIVRDQWIPISIDIDLDAGTQTAKYNGQLLFTDSWNRQGGSLQFQAIDIYGGSIDHVYYDDISLTATSGGGAGVTVVETP